MPVHGQLQHLAVEKEHAKLKLVRFSPQAVERSSCRALKGRAIECFLRGCGRAPPEFVPRRDPERTCPDKLLAFNHLRAHLQSRSCAEHAHGVPPAATAK
jgi:hypothetical protein